MNRTCVLVAVMVVGAGLVFGEGKEGGAIDFEKCSAGVKLPAGFAAALTGQGEAGKWEMKEDGTSPCGKMVLAQTSADKTSYRFPMCVLDGVKAKDVEVAVKFKAISGEVDQAGGVVARYKDKDNYYIARANALEGNVRFYKFEAGKRIQLGGKGGLDIEAGKWHDLKMVLKGEAIEVQFNGQKLFEVQDKTFVEAGLTGVWTKADSVTHFDGFVVRSLDQK